MSDEISKVADIPLDECMLITGEFEITSTLRAVNYDGESEFTALFADIEDGCYQYVYGVKSSLVMGDDEIEKVV